jgi:four helix bundle protein
MPQWNGHSPRAEWLHHPTIDNHRSLIAWQLSHKFCVRLLRTTDSFYHPRARPLFDQLKRASISVVASIVEGYALGTTPQFRRHLRIAMGSAAEVECLLDLAKDVAYLPTDVCAELLEAVGETMRVTFGLIRKMQRPRR